MVVPKSTKIYLIKKLLDTYRLVIIATKSLLRIRTLNQSSKKEKLLRKDLYLFTQ